MATASGRTKLSTLREKYPRELEEFDREVKDYYDANRLDDAGEQLRSNIRDFVFDHVVCTVFKPGGAYTANLHLVGSSANGCGLRSSDVDLCLLIAEQNGTYPTHRSFVVGILGKLREAIRFSRSTEMAFGKLQLIKTAKVPIVKFTVSYSGKTLSVDICVNQFASIDNTRLLRHYAKLDERFPMLCVLVKLWARSSGLNNAWRKTFSRYCFAYWSYWGCLLSIIEVVCLCYALNLLVLHYLVSASAPPVLPNLLRLCPEFFARSTTVDGSSKADTLPSMLKYEKNNTQSIGELMLGFFYYYSHFDFPSCAISVAHGACVPRTALPQKHRYDLILIVDPYQESNPARHITGKTKAFRSTLADLLSQATAPIVDGEPDAPDDVKADTSAADANSADEYFTAESDEEALHERSESSRKLPRGGVSNGIARCAAGETPSSNKTV